MQREKANPYQAEKKRQGGPEHEYWKYRIAEHLRNKGYEIEIESPIGEGKTIDIVASKDGQRLAIEIETGKSDVFENVLKNINHECSKIVMIAMNDKIEKAILLKLKENLLSQFYDVEVFRLDKYLKIKQ